MPAEYKADMKIRLLFAVIIIFTVLITYWPSVTNGLWGDSLAFVHSCRFEGINCVNPYREWSIDSVDSYWLHREMISEITGPMVKTAEHYTPPLAGFLMFIQSNIFKANFQLYHMVSLLLLILIALTTIKLLRDIGGSDLQSFVAAFIVAVHPALSFDVSVVDGQTYLLMTLFWLLTIKTVLHWKNSKPDALKLVLFFTFGLLSHSLMLSVLIPAFYLLYKKRKSGRNQVLELSEDPQQTKEDDLADKTANIETIKTAKACWILLLSSLIFFFYRAFMPWLSGSHSLEGWYQNYLFQAFVKPFGYWFNSIGMWLTILPPKYWFVLPIFKTLSGFMLFGIFIVILVRLFKKESGILAFASLSLLSVLLFTVFDESRLFNVSLTSIWLAVITVDLLTLVYEKFKSRLVKVLLVIVFLLMSKLALDTNYGIQDYIAFYSKTSDRYSTLLINKLNNLPQNSRIYIFNFWAMAPLLPLEVELKLDREDVNVHLMTPDASVIPNNLPLVDNFYTEIFNKGRKTDLPSTKLKFGMIDKNVLYVKAEKGVLFRTMSEINQNGKYTHVPDNRYIEGNGFQVRTVGERHDSAPTGLQIVFDDYIMNPKNLFVIWDEGKWKIFNPAETD